MADDRRLIDVVAPNIRTVDRVRWPGGERDVGLLRLHASEIEDAEVAAREHIRKRGLDLDAETTADLIERALQAELLFRAVVDLESKGQPEHRLFKGSAEVRARMEPWARDNLMAWLAYNTANEAAGFAWPTAADAPPVKVPEDE
ncbi:MAG: hypothetical protein ABH877_00770 [bacterium]